MNKETLELCIDLEQNIADEAEAREGYFQLLRFYYDLFKKNLNKISKKNNGKALDEEEYEFLYSADNESMAISEHDIKEIDNSLLPKQDAEELLIDTSAKKNKSILSISTEASSSILGKYKMKDYSPLDLLRYKSQISNFLILSFFLLSCPT